MKKITTEVSAKKEQYGDLVVTVHDKHGNIKQRVEQPVDSFNRQMWRLLQRNFTGQFGANMTFLNGSTGTFVGLPLAIGDAQTGSYRGTVVGSGTNPTTYDTVTMQTLINIGSGVNELSAQEETVEIDYTNNIAIVTRSFVSLNAASSAISVNEVGLCLAGNEDFVATNVVALFVRDVLLSTVSVSYEETLTVQYKLRISNGNNNYFNATVRTFGLPRSSARNLVNTTGSLVSFSASQLALRAISPEGFITNGLVVGTSNTAFAKTQNNLISRIAHGNSAGQLFYHPSTNTVIQENSTTNSMRFMLMRTVENRSGSNIEIKEVGLFTDAGATSPQSFMLDRRVVEPPVTVTNGNTVTFTWEFCYTV
jgi:hypothetical protein